MSINAINNGIIVEPIAQAEAKSPGGVMLVGAENLTATARVLSVGPGHYVAATDGKPTRVPPDVRVGDVVAYKPKTGTRFHDNGQERLLLSDYDLIGVVR